MKKIKTSYIIIFFSFVFTTMGIVTKQPILFIFAIIIAITGIVKRIYELKNKS